MTKKLTHVGPDGTPRMVDVSDKTVTAREAVARGRIVMSRAAAKLASSGGGKKGDPIQVARLAGIMAAKRTADLIPLCHPLPLTHVDVALEVAADSVEIESSAETTAQTGVEMEALVAATVAALTVYDMAKAIDDGMEIEAVTLVEKTKAPLE